MEDCRDVESRRAVTVREIVAVEVVFVESWRAATVRIFGGKFFPIFLLFGISSRWTIGWLRRTKCRGRSFINFFLLIKVLVCIFARFYFY